MGSGVRGDQAGTWLGARGPGLGEADGHPPKGPGLERVQMG